MAYRSGGPKVLAIVLAGGEGKRLMPLTRDRAKPAVPFGGIYRLVDFALSNVVNSGYLKVVVLTQYKSHSLDRHVTKTWRMSTMLGNYVAPIPAQQRIVVVGADHVYRMDFSQMVDQHMQWGAGVTVAAIRQPIDMADQFGVIEVDDEDPTKISAFREKPSDPKGLPDSPDEILASMGNYVFTADVLVDAVTRDHDLAGSRHDMGGDIVPALVARDAAYTYDFKKNVIPGGTDRDKGYWRDVGTLDSYFDAHMDLISVHPIFNLYNYDWPIYTDYGPYPPAKFVHGAHGRFGEALNSAVSPGTVISGARVTNSVIGANCRVHSYSELDQVVMLDNVTIGRQCRIQRAIIDKNVEIPEGTEIGLDPARDAARGFTITENGGVVIGKGAIVEP